MLTFLYFKEKETETASMLCQVFGYLKHISATFLRQLEGKTYF